MNNLWQYHLESTMIITVLFLLYQMLFRKETFFQINRFLLLLIPIISYIIPLIHIEITSEIYNNPITELKPFIIETMSPTVEKQKLPWLMIFYLIGLGVTTLFFIQKITTVKKFVKNIDSCKQIDGIKIYHIDKENTAFSFFNQIYMNTSSYDDFDNQQILYHEKVHVKQKHSFDVLFIHLLIIFQWFNPILWLLKKEIQENHEFIADKETSLLSKTMQYHDLLLRHATGIPLSSLVHSFNHYSLKRRFKMLLKKQSSKRNLLKYLLIIPIIMVAFWSISISGAEQLQAKNISSFSTLDILTQQTKDTSKVYQVVKMVAKFKGGSKELYKFLAKNISYPKLAKEKKIQGRVYLEFVVEKDGSISDVEVLRGIGGGCDEEAIRVIKSMPKWKPAKNDKGEVVRSKYRLPLKFSLD